VKYGLMVEADYLVALEAQHGRDGDEMAVPGRGRRRPPNCPESLGKE